MTAVGHLIASVCAHRGICMYAALPCLHVLKAFQLLGKNEQVHVDAHNCMWSGPCLHALGLQSEP